MPVAVIFAETRHLHLVAFMRSRSSAGPGALVVQSEVSCATRPESTSDPGSNPTDINGGGCCSCQPLSLWHLEIKNSSKT